MLSTAKVVVASLALAGGTLANACKCVSEDQLSALSSDMDYGAQHNRFNPDTDSFEYLLAIIVRMGILQSDHLRQTHSHRSARLRLLQVRAKLQRRLLRYRSFQLGNLGAPFLGSSQCALFAFPERLRADLLQRNQHQRGS